MGMRGCGDGGLWGGMRWVERREGPGEARFLRHSGQVSHAGRETYLREDVAPPRFALGERGVRGVAVTVLSAGGTHSLLSVLECPQLMRLVLLRSAVQEAAQVGGARVETRLAALQADRPRCQAFDDSHCLGVDALRRRLGADQLGGELPVALGGSSVCGRSDGTACMRSVRRALAAALWMSPHLAPTPVIVLATAEEVAAWRMERVEVCPQGPSCEARGGAGGSESVMSHFAERVELDGAVVWLTEPGKYCRGLWMDCPEILQAFEFAQMEREESAQPAELVAGKSSRRFKAHLPKARLQRLLVEGVCVAGEFQARRADGGGVVLLGQGRGKDVFLPGPAEKNRAMPGDRVVIQIMPESEWATEESLTDSGVFRDFENSNSGSDGISNEGLVPTGCVVGILDRAEHYLVAVVGEEDRKALEAEKFPAYGDAGSVNQRRRVLCVPRNRAYPKCVVRTFRPWDLLGKVFVIRVGEWDQNSKCPAATFVRVVGEAGTLSGDTGAVLAECGIEPRDFSEDVLRGLPPEDWVAPAEEINRRWDLRGVDGLCICSIDPPGCTDVDDVLSVRRISGGRVEVGVHIADVSYFVRPGSVLDAEARRRGTTVYLVGQRFNMLPARLSENLCSLVSGQDRLAFSVVWTLNEETLEECVGDDERPSVWVGRTVIKSQYQLSYEEAQDLLEGRRPAIESVCGGLPGGKIAAQEASRMQSALQVLSRLAARLHKKRMADDAVELDEAELSFGGASTKGGSENVKAPTIKRKVATMALIAELMVAANAAAARKCVDAVPRAALVRRHAPPPANSPALRRLATLLAAGSAKSAGVQESIDNSEIDRLMHELSGVGIAQALEDFGKNSSAKLRSVARSYAVRAMAEAEYVIPAYADGQLRHFGLALENYTHFTSPIRRYADLEVHRQLSRIVSSSPGSSLEVGLSRTSAIAKECNERHRAAKKAQSYVQKLHLLYFLAGHPQVEQASVTEVSDAVFEVVCPRLQLGGTVEKSSQKGEHSSGRNVKVLDSVWVRISASQEGTRPPELQIEWLDDGHAEVKAAQSQGRKGPSTLPDEEILDIGQVLAQAGGIKVPVVDMQMRKRSIKDDAAPNSAQALQDLLLAARQARTLQAVVQPVPDPDACSLELRRQVLAQECRRGRAWAKLVSGKSLRGSRLANQRQERLKNEEVSLSQAKALAQASEIDALASAAASLSLEDPSFFPLRKKNPAVQP